MLSANISMKTGNILDCNLNLLLDNLWGMVIINLAQEKSSVEQDEYVTRNYL